MRKLKVFESISVDGFFTDKSQDMNWAYAAAQDAEFSEWVGGNAGAASDLLFGRKTFQMMEAYWPTPMAAQQMPDVARGMNAAKKWVATRKPPSRWKTSWANSERLDGDLVEAVRKLKRGRGSDIVILGSGEVAAQLGEAGLVDEYQFVVIPIALGKGRGIFKHVSKLKLMAHRVFACGRVVLTYAT